MALLLLVEDDKNARRLIAMGLEDNGHVVTACDGPKTAKKEIEKNQFDVVLTDLRMEGRDAGLDIVDMCSRLQSDTPVLLLTAYASADTAVEAMRRGAFDYLTKPVSSEELAEAVDRAIVNRSMDETHQTEDRIMPDDGGLVGESVVMQRVRERLFRAAKRDFTVLISGESGTGKEVAARFLHSHSPRSEGPFVPVHCGAIPADLFESELFGHCKGAFTGADSNRPGLIESANGGTLFLDEIGDMPLPVQVKLLRVLQDHRVRRVGEEKERQVDIRVVAASNRDLHADVKAGRFREDLFYRLNVVPVHMPPLRQRREDIPPLAQNLLSRWIGKDESMKLPPEGLKKLEQLPLMGNVRELENLLHRMIAMADGDTLDVGVLDEMRHEASDAHHDDNVHAMRESGQNLDEWLEQIERRLVGQALDECEGNATKAAKFLGISFRSLRYRLKKLGLKS
jgi:DNA-binding NtrC family response regulator